METLKKGSKGDAVKVLQKALGITADGIFGSGTEAAVKAFQTKKGLTADGIVGAKTWAALGVVDSNTTTTSTAHGYSLKKSKRTINEIIVHCTATVEGKSYTVDDVRKWHKANGWSDIGYHYLIYLDGSIHDGRDVDKTGAHTSGHNSNSIGVCYVGGIDSNKKAKDTRTDAQKASLLKLLKELKAIYPKATIYGHRNFTNLKACPSFDAKTEYKNI